MKRHKVEFTVIYEDGGEPEHIVREHDVLYYTDCEGYNALVFVPDERAEVFSLVWSATGYGTLDELKRHVERVLRRDAVDLVNARVRVGEVSNG